MAGDYKYATDLIVSERAKDYRVRRLTPEECGRLQGFPDGWAVEGSDTAKYKMWGNGMCLVNMLYIMQGLIEFDEDIL